MNWFEEISWPYESLRQIAIIPRDALGHRFSLLILVDDSGREIIAVPKQIDLKELGQFLINSGVSVTVGRSAPEEFCRPLGLLGPAIVCGVAWIGMVGASIFYAVNAGERRGQGPLTFEELRARGGGPLPRGPRPQVPRFGERLSGNYTGGPVVRSNPIVRSAPPVPPPSSLPPAPPAMPAAGFQPPMAPGFAADPPVIPAGAVPLDLFTLIDPVRDQARGLWNMDNGCLVSSPGDTAALVIPSAVPKEYMLTIVAERIVNNDSFCVGLLMNGRQVLVVLEGWGKTLSGLNIVDGKTADNNDTTYRSPVFVAGTPCTIVCTVRDSHIQVSCDGRPLIDWRGNAHRMALDRRFWAALPSDKLFLGSWKSSFRISKAELISLVE